MNNIVLFRLPTRTELESHHKDDFLSSLSEIAQTIRDQANQGKRKEDEEDKKELDHHHNEDAKPSSRGDYFQKCNQVLKAQMEVSWVMLLDFNSQNVNPAYSFQFN